MKGNVFLPQTINDSDWRLSKSYSGQELIWNICWVCLLLGSKHFLPIIFMSSDNWKKLLGRYFPEKGILQNKHLAFVAIISSFSFAFGCVLYDIVWRVVVMWIQANNSLKNLCWHHKMHIVQLQWFMNGSGSLRMCSDGYLFWSRIVIY